MRGGDCAIPLCGGGGLGRWAFIEPELNVAKPITYFEPAEAAAAVTTLCKCMLGLWEGNQGQINSASWMRT